jgi:hypothetical protein
VPACGTVSLECRKNFIQNKKKILASFLIFFLRKKRKFKFLAVFDLMALCVAAFTDGLSHSLIR